jgi:hypothetical protein
VPTLLPWSPIEGGDERLEAERASSEEIERFVKT